MAVQKEWLEKDYYQKLRVDPDAEPKTITKAYRSLARQLHPDANPGDPVAEEQFKDVAAAYDVLNDPEKRREYDQVRTSGFRGFGGSFGESVDLGDIGDLFGGLFGQTRRGDVPIRGNDIRAELKLSFDESIYGTVAEIEVPVEKFCGSCSGTGAAPGTSTSMCDGCNGQGVTQSRQGFFSFATTCMLCNGSGHVVSSPCNVCSGRGIVGEVQDVKLRIPAGVENGQIIRVPGRGTPGMNGGTPGDLFVHIEILSHPWFERDGIDVRIEVPVEIFEAALGTKIDVPTVYGEKVKIVVPAGTKSGKILRVSGKGVKVEKATGDMYVRLIIDTPEKLNPLQKQALKDLEAATKRDPRAHFFS